MTVTLPMRARLFDLGRFASLAGQVDIAEGHRASAALADDLLELGLTLAQQGGHALGDAETDGLAV